MSLLSALLSPGFRQAAAVVIQVGPAQTEIGDLATLVSSIECRTSRLDAATATITIDDRREGDGAWMAADSGLFTRWAEIRLTADFVTHQEEIFRGYITELKPAMPANPGEAKLVLECQDQGAGLGREHMRRLWGEPGAPMSDLDILTALISPLGLTTETGCGKGQSSRPLSMDAVPIVFLRDRARANGYELILSEGKVWFGPKRLEAEPQETILIYAGSGTNCISFAVSDAAQGPDQVTYELAPRTEGATPETGTVTPDLDLMGTTATASEGASLGTPAVARITREGDETPEETRARAQAMVNDASFRIKASGELDGTLYGHVLRPGLPVRVDGAGTRNGGTWYVDGVTHAFSPQGYRQQFQLIRNATGDAETLSSPPLSKALSAIASLF